MDRLWPYALVSRETSEPEKSAPSTGSYASMEIY
jgi:hypothetical protein